MTQETTFLAEIAVIDGCAVLRAVGDLDILAEDALTAAVDKALAHGLDVIFDLRQATFIGSVALSAVVRACRTLGADGRAVTVQVARPMHRRAFEVTGIADLVCLQDGTASRRP